MSPVPSYVDERSVGDYLRGGAGLLLGPGGTHRKGLLGKLTRHLATGFDVEACATYLDTCDLALGKGVPELQVRTCITGFLAAQDPLANIHRLAAVRWAAVISSCMDSSADEALLQEAARQPTRRTVTVLSDLSSTFPPRSIPIFKILGSIANDDCVSSQADYLVRRALWGPVVHNFGDAVKGGALICMGFEELDWLLADLVAFMLSRPQFTPRKFLFAKDDPVTANPQLRRLLEPRNLLGIATTTVSDLLKAAKEAPHTSTRQISLALGTRESRLKDALISFEDLAIAVNLQLETAVDREDRNVLLDLLFSPSKPRWDPFVYDLDFPRSTLQPFLLELTQRIAQGQYLPAACVLRGGAATGKTAVLKRLAFELAKSGHLTIWLRPWFFQDGGNEINRLMQRLAEFRQDFEARIFLFMDDPPAFTGVTPFDLVEAAGSAGLELVLILGVRTSDWEIADDPAMSFAAQLPIIVDDDLPEDLTRDEAERLPAYLVQLAVCKDLEDGQRSVTEAASRSANDVLTMLYWLLPETQQSIKASIRDEYYRLGSSPGLKQLILGQMQHSPELVRRAYERVAVADRYRAPLPVEILVGSLGVSYADWLSATPSEGHAWGLLYSEDLPQSQTHAYRTRNTIVTKFVLEAINGGSIGHAAEVKLLGELLGACRGSQAVYREFCVRILTQRDNLAHLEFSEGLDLFEKAEAALPFPDKTLVHHRGLWIKNSGKDPQRAKDVLQEALKTPVYPYASRKEADEHILTSLAATTLDQIHTRTITLEAGKQEVLGYLNRARARQLFNPNALHVETRLVLRLLSQTAEDDPDVLAISVATLASLDNALLLFELSSRGSVATGDLRLLEKAREDLLSKLADLEDLRTLAERAWERHSRQEGFVVVGRALYGDAKRSFKGRVFKAAFEYLDDARSRIESSGAVALSSLTELMLQIYYHWRVRRGRKGSGSAVDWRLLLKLSQDLLSNRRRRTEPFFCYIQGLAHAHLGEWQDANRVFAELRTYPLPGGILHAERDSLLTDDLRERLVQGTVRSGGTRLFLKVQELGVDVLARRTDRWPAEGEIAHAEVKFSFAGPLAIKR